MKIEGACHPVISVCPFNLGENEQINSYYCWRRGSISGPLARHFTTGVRSQILQICSRFIGLQYADMRLIRNSCITCVDLSSKTLGLYEQVITITPKVSFFLINSCGEKNGGNGWKIPTLPAPGIEPGTSRTPGMCLSHYTTGVGSQFQRICSPFMCARMARAD